MSVISPYKKKPLLWKLALLPISILYGMVIHIRHFLFRYNIIRRTRFNFPIIVIGNLSLGGTGKTPFTAYLCQLLYNDYQIAVVSRGYKRKTVGFLEVTETSHSTEVGDEPFWFKRKFPKITMIVGEDRVLSIMYLLQQKPFLDVILLDDAFQHRKLQADLNIVLTEYSNLYIEDKLIPVGTLRDTHSAIKRADMVVVTKCPSFTEGKSKAMKEVRQRLHLEEEQQLFFSMIEYGTPYAIIENSFNFQKLRHTHILLVTGIATPEHLVNYLTAQKAKVTHQAFADHFDFSYEDIIDMMVAYDKLPSPKIILCTEKDAVKLKRFQKYWEHVPVFVIPIELKFLEGEADFAHTIFTYIKKF